MIELKFGLPAQGKRTKKEEKYPDQAVMTMFENKGKGYAKKFEFNSKSLECLKLEDDESTIDISLFSPDGNVYIVKSIGNSGESPYKLTKNTPKSFSNSKVYDVFTDKFDLDTSKDNEFLLTEVPEASYGDGKIYVVSLISEDSKDEADVQESNLANQDLLDELDEEIISEVESDDSNFITE